MTAPAAVINRIPASRRGRLVENGVFAMALFVFAELMMFSGFISAHVISRRSALPGTWPPADQPRLPVESTAFNTAALLLSGVLLLLAHRARRGGRPAVAERWLTGSILLGTLFVTLQGVEWVRLLAQGLTVSSSLVGGFFYLIVGTHALHAIAALGFLTSAWLAMRAGRLTGSHFGAAQVFWYFVVLLWPLLYWKVYL
jgi:cytochrome c oxidase subunit 3